MSKRTKRGGPPGCGAQFIVAVGAFALLFFGNGIDVPDQGGSVPLWFFMPVAVMGLATVVYVWTRRVSLTFMLIVFAVAAVLLWAASAGLIPETATKNPCPDHAFAVYNTETGQCWGMPTR